MSRDCLIFRFHIAGTRPLIRGLGGLPIRGRPGLLPPPNRARPVRRKAPGIKSRSRWFAGAASRPAEPGQKCRQRRRHQCDLVRRPPRSAAVFIFSSSKSRTPPSAGIPPVGSFCLTSPPAPRNIPNKVSTAWNTPQYCELFTVSAVPVMTDSFVLFQSGAALSCHPPVFAHGGESRFCGRSGP